MNKRTLTLATVLGAIVLLGATVAWAGERGRAAKRARSLKALGLKVYWSLLTEDQKEEAKVILAEHVAETAPDRLQAFARLVRYKADVAAVLTREQRLEALRIRHATRDLSEDDRREVADRLLDGTDREALARRVTEHGNATPEEKVRIGLEVLDQVYAVLEPELAARLALSDEQRSEVRGLYEDLAEELKPVALRIETAKAAAIQQAVGILDDAQRDKLERIRTDVMERVIAFLRG